ncbi:hypothetical protein AB0395_47060 [Streptosporangium sp. NPDC051023]|uniref:hypothetical protein n=1 Tax=Streptosporangium sp. NPDC051023 TaxID=3155410 RepID=UPI00345094D4
MDAVKETLTAASRTSRSTITCVCCGDTGPCAGRGLIRACYMRRYKNGTLHQFPRGRQQEPEPIGRIGVCVCCGTEGPIKGRGLTYACYQRHRWAGTLSRFPLTTSPRESIRRAQEERQAAYVARQEDYTWLREQGESPEHAVARVGLKVSPSTVRRYERLVGGAA